MNIEELRDFCLSLKGAEEKMPFGDDILVFAVKGKLFCLTDIANFESINLKCDPEEAINLREIHTEVIPGYHMNKNHWNTIKTKGKISDKQMKEWIINSYNLVVSTLTKKIQKDLKEEL